MLRHLLRKGEPVEDVLDATRRAGRELVSEGNMSAETLAAVSGEIVTLEERMRLQSELDARLHSRRQACSLPDTPDADRPLRQVIYTRITM